MSVGGGNNNTKGERNVKSDKRYEGGVKEDNEGAGGVFDGGGVSEERV